MISLQQRTKFCEVYNSVISKVPDEIRLKANCDIYWEQEEDTYPHIDKNLVRQLPEHVIRQLVDLYENLRTGKL